VLNINSVLSSYVKLRVEDYQRIVKGERNIVEPDPKESLIESIYHRIAFVEYIDSISDDIARHLIDGQFIRSFQANLLLGAGDALGEGIDYYSFQDFISSRKNKELVEEIYMQSDVSSIDGYKSSITQLLKQYKKGQSVKQSFHKFWNERSNYIKQKIVLCYFPFKFAQFEEKYTQIIEKFYEQYRNPFTHQAKDTFPQFVGFSGFPLQKLGQITGIAFGLGKKGIRVIDIPLNPLEATRVIDEGKGIYSVTDTGKCKRVEITDIDMLLQESTRLGASRNELATEHYISRGIFKVMEMALLEACSELQGSPINWESDNPLFKTDNTTR
jgi:hypothetical protein